MPNFHASSRARMCWSGRLILPLLTMVFLVSPLAKAQSILQTYRELNSVGLDPTQVYHVREFVLDRQDLHLYLNDGTIAFTRAVNGRITGAFFEGDGQVLLRPPNAAERNSLGLFTGLGVLDERFESAYLRFNDDLYDQIRASSRKADDADLAHDQNETAANLAHADALRMLGTLTTPPGAMGARDQFLHLKISSERLGNFDVIYDSLAPEQFFVGRMAAHTNDAWYDIWMAFPGEDRREMDPAERTRLILDPWSSYSTVKPTHVRIDAKLLPPENIEATAELDLDVVNGGQSILVFELSRYLNVSQVSLGDGTKLDFIHNEALSGTDLSKRGNDLVTVILPNPLKTGERFTLRFNYAGAVMKQAGTGLLFVGERGIWYPNRGLAMAQFDLKFHWPRDWTLIATGRQLSEEQTDDGVKGHWVSETEIPLAGFNLGQYTHGTAKAGEITINAFATTSLETIVPSLTEPPPPNPKDRTRRTLSPKQIEKMQQLSPAEGSQAVAEYAARSVEQYSQWFGPYPFSTLSVTQFPGNLSQGWPTLIYLSSAAFLSFEDRQKELNMNALQQVIYGQVMLPHEAAHQWWGDLVGWKSYRDQWLVEALADYSAMMLLEQQHPENVRFVLEAYRRDLLYKNEAGRRYLEAGPVSLGYRLSSSVFPNGYIVISYGRGAWLMHMLRSLYRDYAVEAGFPGSKGDEAFRNALRGLREHYAHTNITVRELQKEMESHIAQVSSPSSPVKHSLDWFFDGWVNGTAVPKITVKDVKIRQTGKQAFANFTIAQDECPDTLMTEVPIYAVDANNKYKLLRRVMADGLETKARLAVPAGTKRLAVDPEWTLLTSNPDR